MQLRPVTGELADKMLSDTYLNRSQTDLSRMLLLMDKRCGILPLSLSMGSTMSLPAWV